MIKTLIGCMLWVLQKLKVILMPSFSRGDNDFRELQQRIMDELQTMNDKLDRMGTSNLEVRRKVAQMAIDTAGILAAVAKEVTENASLRVLVAAQSAAVAQAAADLKAALAANDPAALAAVQADLDKAAADLSANDADTAAALAANTTPAPGG